MYQIPYIGKYLYAQDYYRDASKKSQDFRRNTGRNFAYATDDPRAYAGVQLGYTYESMMPHASIPFGKLVRWFI